jgi:hypothetical protein
VVDGERPERPDDDDFAERGLTDAVWELIETCWAEERQKRPKFPEIADALQALKVHGSPSVSLKAREDKAEDLEPALIAEDTDKWTLVVEPAKADSFTLQQSGQLDAPLAVAVDANRPTEPKQEDEPKEAVNRMAKKPFRTGEKPKTPTTPSLIVRRHKVAHLPPVVTLPTIAKSTPTSERPSRSKLRPPPNGPLPAPPEFDEGTTSFYSVWRRHID